MEELLKDILAELRKINEYIDIQKGQIVDTVNNRSLKNSSASKQERKKLVTFQEVLTAYRQYLQE